MMKTKNKRGFSLMELLAVMAIMGILATIASTGYFSAVRGMKRRRAVANFVATLQQARQRACIDGTRMAVVCFPEKSVGTIREPNVYVVSKALGRVTYVSGSEIGDEFTPLATIFGAASSQPKKDGDYDFGSRRIYNLSSKEESAFVDVEGSVTPGPEEYGELESGLTGEDLAAKKPPLLWCFIPSRNGEGSPAKFKVGDLYGIEASPVAVLPKNIFFDSEKTFMFTPDGRAEGGTIVINDQSVKGQKKTVSTITVNSTGGITGGDKVDLN